ncbi:MAG: tetratricopeptide repeat protein [Sphingobacteriaceae bacterium]|nr:tetratricopeptide repeat protein [Sphingobacteriaceae bacterium]
MQRITTLCFLIFVSVTLIKAQTQKLDSLLSEIPKSKQDTSIIKLYLSASAQASNITPDSGIFYANKALVLSEKIKFKRGVGSAYYSIGLYNQHKSNYYNNNLYGEKALKVFEELGNEKRMYDCYNLIGNGYSALSNFEKALEYHFKSLKGREKIKDSSGIALSLMNVGRVFRVQQDYKKAVEYYNKALDLSIKKKLNTSIANCLNNIGNVYYYQQKYDTALIYQIKSLNVNKEAGKEDALLTNYSNIAGIYIYLKKFDSSLKYYNVALNIAKVRGDKTTIANCHEGFAAIFAEKKQYAQSITNLNIALEIAKEIGAVDYLGTLYKDLADIYALNKNYKEAFEAHKNHKIYYDSLYNQNNTKQLTETELKYKFEKQQELEKEEALRKEMIQAVKTKDQQQLIYFFCGGFIIVLILLFFSIKNYKQKEKINLELESKNEVIEEKNKDITDSIKYAKRLQDAILPTTQLIHHCFQDSFVLFKPKDIVSGDFYWMEKLEDTIFFAVVDCTGHGVPGAFMSIMAHNLIQQAIYEKQLKDPSDILNYLNISLNEKLNKQDTAKVNDGMDVAMCAYNTKNSELKYAGANNPLWIVDQEGLLKELSPNKNSIGFQNTGSFSQTIEQPKKGTMLYLFSDGYADQFGGKNGKKLMKKTLKGILTSIAGLNMDEQQNVLNTKLEEWKGSLQQVDDVCIVGIRI